MNTSKLPSWRSPTTLRLLFVCLASVHAAFAAEPPVQLYVSDGQLTDANRISRGHMASNLEMKGHGDETEGQLSQTESFSFANVVPQMQACNAPFWAAIEQDCLRLAQIVGSAAVISGPAFQPEPGKPLLQTGSGLKVRIPIPTHFFKVIIVKVDGRRTAIAFLVPHRADLKAEARSTFLVSVRTVEEATGINFMPDLGANDALEKVPQQELVELLHED